MKLLDTLKTEPSRASASHLDSDFSVRKIGYGIAFLMFGGFAAWSSLAPLESAAMAAGVVKVRGNSQAIQHLEGGIVAQISVANGDYVKRGDVLLRLDDVKERAELEIVEGRLWATRAKIERLTAERDDSNLTIFGDSQVVPDSRAMLSADNERALFAARRADRLGEIEVLEQRIGQLQTQIGGTVAVLEARQAVALSLSQEISELEELLSEGYVDKQRIRELRRSLATTLGDVSEMESRIAAAEVALKETHLKVLQFDKRFKTQVVDELTQAQDQFYDLTERHRALLDRVERMVIRSPTAGVVVGLEINTVGAVLSPRAELLSIVPDVDQLVISTRLNPMDIDRIKIGQDAEVRFSVFKDAYTVTGRLTKVSADSLVDQGTGQAYFDATVELLEQDLGLLGESELVPGMPAVVLIKTGTRTFLSYLTSPMRRAFSTSLLEE